MTFLLNTFNMEGKKLRSIGLMFLFMMLASFINAQEICNNGIDDDGDGLIDLYDSDCIGIGDYTNFFYNLPDPTCTNRPPVLQTWTLQEKFNTNVANGGTAASPVYQLDQRCGLFVGDLDGDGVPEIVGKDGSQATQGTGMLRVFSGVDGTHLQSFSQTSHHYSQTAIADVNKDGLGDIFLVDNSRYLVRLQYNGSSSAITNIWTSVARVVSTHQSPQLADFNQDGTPEVYVGNMIFDAITGTRWLNGGTGENSGRISSSSATADAWPIAYDVFKPGDLNPDGSGVFGPEAAGLELIAGNKVYFVDFDPSGAADNGSITLAATININSISGLVDGYTSIADINGDDKIDIVVSASNGSGYIYAWDPYNLNEIGSAYLLISGGARLGRCNIADFDGDGEAEIGAAGRNCYVLLESDLTLKWRKDGLQDGSQMTGSTVFDFEGDGSSEVVYSDELTLYVWKGTDGSPIASINSRSGTRTDYPLVADVDDDGQAEIIITAQNVAGPSVSDGTSWVSVYRSADAPWVAARETWNQHGYFVTNTEDNLFIPTEQQSMVSPVFNNDFNSAFNQFLVQTTMLNKLAQPTFATGDLTTENILFDLSDCPTLHQVHFSVTFENHGDWKIPRNTPVSVYDGDPYQPGATYLDAFVLPENIEPGGSLTVDYTVSDPDQDGNMNLYILANHSHFTVDGTPLNLPLQSGRINSPTLECDYDNNLGFIVSINTCVAASPPVADLDRNDNSGATGIDYQTAYPYGSNSKIVVVDDDVFIRDSDTPNNLTSAIVTLTNTPDGGSESIGITSNGLTLASNYGINVTQTATQITMTGTANSLLEYETLLKEIWYNNTSASPDLTQRDISVEVQDATSSNSPLAFAYIIIDRTPTIDLDNDDNSGASGNDYQTTFTEGDLDLAIVDTDVNIVDVDNAQITRATITLTNIPDGTAEGITISNLPTGITQDLTVTTPGVIVLQGSATLANYQTALGLIAYNNSSENPSSDNRIITVSVFDGYLESAPATTTITVVPVNDPPVISGPATDLSYEPGVTGAQSLIPVPDITDVDNDNMQSASISLSAGYDNGIDVLAITNNYGITGSFNATSGVISLTGIATKTEYEAVISTLTFTTNSASTTQRTVSITVTDETGAASNIYTRNININTGVNDAPVAQDDAYSVNASQTINEAAAGVLANDSDPDGDAITVSTTGTSTGSLNGSLTLNADGSFSYNPDETNASVVALTYGQTVTETFTYTATDGTLTSNTVNIVFTVVGENSAPIADDEAYTIPENGVVTDPVPGVLVGDTDPDGDALTVSHINNSTSSVIVGSYGVLNWNPDGSFTYDPDEFNPTVDGLQAGDPDLVETFTYRVTDPYGATDNGTITINIQGVNDPPSILAVSTDETTVINTNLVFNSINNNKISISDVDGDDQTVTLTITNGTISLSGITGLTFTTGNGTSDATMVFSGTLADVNTALDGATFIPTNGFTGNATVAIGTDDGHGGTANETINILVHTVNNPPVITIPVAQTINEDQTIAFTNGSATEISIADTDGDNQTVVISVANGTFSLSGTTGLTGVTGNSTSNVSFSGSLADINTALDGAVFTPNSNYNGPASVQVSTNDGIDGTDSKTMNITINAVADSPIAVDDALIVAEDGSGNGNVLTNDSDPENDPLTVNTTPVSGPSNGILALNAGGTYTYTPNPDYSGSDSFVYEVCDGTASTCSQATVNITVTPSPLVSLSASPTTIVENVATSTLTASLDKISSSDITVTLTYSGTATGSGTDYTAASTTITVLAGNLTGTTTVSSVNDAIFEEDETIIADITTVTGGGADEDGAQQATVTITDDETANAVLSVTTQGDENGPVNIVYTVTLDVTNNTGSAITFDFDNLGTGSATSGTDYTAVEGAAQISVANGATMGTITITVIDDAIYELTETIDAQISNSSNANVTITTASATADIADDDSAPTVTLSASPSSIVENGGVSTLTATLSTATYENVIVTLTYGGTATGSGTDYTAASTTITILAGNTTGTTTVTSVDDAISEGDETVIADITNVTGGGATESGTQSETITIQDDDGVTVTLSASPTSILENGGTSTLTATLDAATFEDVVVNFTYTGTATNGTDYSVATSITITAGNTTGTTDITAINDAIYEGNETVIVDISSVTGGNASESGTQQETVTITDDETAPTVTLSASPSSIVENGGVSTLTATLSTATYEDVIVTLAYAGTATGSGTDYTAGSTTITITAGNTTGTTTVTSVDDAISEGDETVVADITNVTGGGATESGTQSETITIQDDDGVTVTLSASPTTIIENGGTSTLTATLDAATFEDVVVNFTYTGTATNGTDYSIAVSITITAGNTTGTTVVTATNDNIYEGNETVIVDISNVTGGNASESGTQQETVTIDDSADMPTVTLSASPTTIAENGGVSTLTATLSNATYENVTVNLGYTGTATNSTDYGVATSITITAGSLTGTTDITATDDAIFEGSETVITDISSITGGGASESGTQQETVTITDDETAPTVTLSASQTTITENPVQVSTLTATLSTATFEDVIVTLAYAGTATGSGTDYNTASTTITITAGNTTGTTTVTSVDDAISEGDETVVADITNVTGGGATESGTQSEIITIQDDDGVTVTLSASPTSILENGGTSTLTATLDAATFEDVVVNFTYTGTATNGTDYSVATSITITAGNITGTTDITAINDAIYEGNETVIVDISSVSGGNASESGTQQVTVTIDDSADMPTVTLSASPATIAENGGVSTLTATLSNTTYENVIVNLGYTGTATNSTDYGVATSITITAGSLTGTTDITATDDAIYEGSETVITDISSITGGGASESGTQQETVTITDDETAPTVTLSASPTTITENPVQSSTLTATLSTATYEDVTVTLSYAGTATGSGTDYTSASTTITILAGNTTGTTTVTAVDDAISEGDETVIADITNVTGGDATESGTQSETITIQDDDGVTVTLSASPTSILENGGTSTLTATLDAATFEDVVVNFTYTGTATNGTDYSVATSITITAGNITGTTVVTATNDNIYEGNETVIVDISNVTGGNASESGTQTATVTITDDETVPTVTLSASPTTIDENGGTSDLTATLSNISSVDVDVTLTYTGTATNGTDYTGTTTITIPAGSLSASIMLTAIDDASIEGNETIIADITAVTNATEDGIQQETVTITDDDFANNIPDAVDDIVSVDEDGTLNSDVSTNDTGLGDTPVTYTIDSDVSNGTLTLNSDGTYTYIPDTDFNGTDSFTYTVCDTDGDCSSATVTITVNPVNDGPVAVNDTTGISGTGDISVLDNDTDPEGDILTVIIITDPTDGTATVVDGVITYTASGDYCGIDSLEYQICDPEPQCATAWVIVNVQPADADADGIPDSEETLTADTDNDGILDYLDLDSDNDGIPDQIEAHTDGDACNYEPFDFDEDGTPDYLDIDSDDDGIMDIIEDGGTDDNGDGEIDGFTDNNDDGADDDNMTNGDVDTDNDGSPDYNDLDSDNDGLSDEEEGFDSDCDEDGILDFQDADDCIADLFIPDGFSPNGDGTNDYFVIRGLENYPDNRVTILNRWGNIVFETISYNNDWDGKNTKGVSVGNDDLPEGTYFYILELGNNSNTVKKGYIYLKR